MASQLNTHRVRCAFLDLMKVLCDDLMDMTISEDFGDAWWGYNEGSANVWIALDVPEDLADKGDLLCIYVPLYNYHRDIRNSVRCVLTNLDTGKELYYKINTYGVLALTSSQKEEDDEDDEDEEGNKEPTYDIRTTVIDGIVCKQCNHKLQPMTMEDHLEGNFNQVCPHD